MGRSVHWMAGRASGGFCTGFRRYSLRPHPGLGADSRHNAARRTSLAMMEHACAFRAGETRPISLPAPPVSGALLLPCWEFPAACSDGYGHGGGARLRAAQHRPCPPAARCRSPSRHGLRHGPSISAPPCRQSPASAARQQLPSPRPPIRTSTHSDRQPERATELCRLPWAPAPMRPMGPLWPDRGTAELPRTLIYD